MRIGIDARLYKAGLGIGRYIEQLLKYIELSDGNDEYIVFMRKDMIDTYTPHSQRITKVCADIPWYSIKEQIMMPFMLARYRLDLVHFPHFNIPLLCMQPFVVTIHDLIMIKHTHSSTSAASTLHPFIHYVKYVAYRIVLFVALLRARKVIAVSYHVKNDLRTLLKCPEKKIDVIYEGVSEFTRSKAPLPPVVHAPYILNVGNAYPHKNLALLLKCAELMRDENSDYRIILCGQQDYFQKKLCEEVKNRNLAHYVFHLGTVSDSVLSRLYECAFAVVFPSFEEGFGFGVLEAASHNTPIIATRRGVFEETLGNAYYPIDPQRAGDILDALNRIKYNASEREMIVRYAHERSRLYSWDATARRTTKLYHEIV